MSPHGRPNLALLLLATWALIACGAAAAQPAAAPPALRLHGSAPEGLDPWPFLGAWFDTSRRADIDEVLRQRAAFGPPAVPRNSYGPRDEALWLRLPLQVPDGDPLHWVLSVDYTELVSIWSRSTTTWWVPGACWSTSAWANGSSSRSGPCPARATRCA